MALSRIGSAQRLHPAVSPQAIALAKTQSSPAVQRAAPAGDGLLTFDELSRDQKALLGPNGAKAYAQLGRDNRSVFLLLTSRMKSAGVDFGGLVLKPAEGRDGDAVRRNRLLFSGDASGMERLKASLEQGVDGGTFQEDKPWGPFHSGRADWGVRENREKWTMQLGLGEDGAFVDIDEHNPNSSWGGWLGHGLEILSKPFGRPDPRDIASELGVDLASKARASAPKRRLG